MTRTTNAAKSGLYLDATTAEDLMTPNPVSIRADASVREATALLTDKGFSAAPVIDGAGRPVGVLSRSDILVHDRERVEHPSASHEYYDRGNLVLRNGERLDQSFDVESVDPTSVEDIMTPVVFSVAPHAGAERVVDEMLSLHIHRVFVVDGDGVLVGVVSATDILKHLRPA